MFQGSLTIDTEVKISGDKGDLKAFVAPPGVVVRGKTLDDIFAEAYKARDFMLRVFEKKPDFPISLCSYLDARHVTYTITTSETSVAETPPVELFQFTKKEEYARV